MAASSILFDSHILLWLLQEPKKIGAHSMRKLGQAETCFVSMATIWELGIKHHKGQLAFSPKELMVVVGDMGAELLDIGRDHIVVAGGLAIDHKDPFDRMLLAQAQTDGLLLLTADVPLLKLQLPSVVDARK